MPDIKIRIPEAIRLGEAFEVKTLAVAPPLPNADAEFDASGIPVPHFVGLTASFNGKPVLAVDFLPGTARNVLFVFSLKIDRPGGLILVWRLRDGGTEERRVALAPA